MAFISNQVMFGVAIGFVITGGLCALTALTFKYLEQKKKVPEDLRETSPILSLLKSNGIWYIESVSGNGVIDMQEIDHDKIEEIIGDYIASQIASTGADYSFDIRCSTGDEYTVATSKKSVIDDDIRHGYH